MTAFRFRVFVGLWACICAWLVLPSFVHASQTVRRDARGAEPAMFDVSLEEVHNQTAPVVSPWKSITLDPELAGAWIVAGELDGDGTAEIVTARNFNEDDNHYTCSVAAYTLDGELLWQWGRPKDGRNKLHHDVACQIHDWDGDGQNEVVVAARQKLVQLDGATGAVENSFDIPRHASDCLVFADLAGRGRPEELLVKDRYSQIWAFDRAGNLLWTVENPGNYRTAHQPLPVDIDGDGKDEIVAGYALLNPDGSVRWGLQGLVQWAEAGLPLERGHLDCARVFKKGSTPEKSSLVMTFCGGNRIALLRGDGKKMFWSVEGYHFESADVGEVCVEHEGDEIAVDIAHRERGDSPLWLLSASGELLGSIMTERSRQHVLVNWLGGETQSIVMGTPGALFDGNGRKRVIFDAPDKGMCAGGDMDGDGRQDLLFWSNPASTLTVFKNRRGKKREGEVRPGTGLNFTLY